MKLLKKILLWFVITIAILITGLYVTGYGYIVTAVRKGTVEDLNAIPFAMLFV
jgi:uncharacterized membrane-anchored protein